MRRGLRGRKKSLLRTFLVCVNVLRFRRLCDREQNRQTFCVAVEIVVAVAQHYAQYHGQDKPAQNLISSFPLLFYGTDVNTVGRQNFRCLYIRRGNSKRHCVEILGEEH